jgi:hypothetical protein
VVLKINKQGPNKHFLFLKRKIRPNQPNTLLSQATWRREGGADSCGTSGQIRSTEPQSGEVELSACPMESEAAWTPPIHRVHVHDHHSFVYSLNGSAE